MECSRAQKRDISGGVLEEMQVYGQVQNARKPARRTRGRVMGGVELRAEGYEPLGAQHGWGWGAGEATHGLGDPEQFSAP